MNVLFICKPFQHPEEVEDENDSHKENVAKRNYVCGHPGLKDMHA